jgi:hypothetical protein
VWSLSERCEVVSNLDSSIFVHIIINHCMQGLGGIVRGVGVFSVEKGLHRENKEQVYINHYPKSEVPHDIHIVNERVNLR